MANILDEQERKRKELAAQGIRTRGVAGAQGGAAEVGYVPPSRRNAPINQIPPQNASPQADYARSAEGGAMIPSEKVGQANMLASMPNHGSLTPFEQPADAWIQRSRDFTQSRVGGTNQQLQMQRQEMGTNQSTSLTQMASQIDPSIRRDAERAREWRIMSPQQRREEVDRLAMEQDAGIAKTASSGTWEDRDKYARSLADPTGMFIDSYGRENPMYSPGTADRIRNYQRKIEPAIARMMSSYDRTKWDSPQAYLDAASALPEVIEAGEFGKAIVFNIGRKYASPQIRAQMDAEDRNQKLLRDWMVSRGAEEIAKAQEQNGGFRFTNDGTGDLATQIALNRDKDLASGQIWRQFLAETPQIYTAMDGKVVVDQAQAAKFNEAAKQKEMAEQRTFSEMQAKQKQADQLAEKVLASKEHVAQVERATGQVGRLVVNEKDGSIIDIQQYAEKKAKDMTPREKIAATDELMKAKASWQPLLEYAKLDAAGIQSAIDSFKKSNPAVDPVQLEQQASIMMQNWQTAQSMGGMEAIQRLIGQIDAELAAYQ